MFYSMPYQDIIVIILTVVVVVALLTYFIYRKIKYGKVDECSCGCCAAKHNIVKQYKKKYKKNS